MDSKKEYDMGGFDKKIGSSHEYLLLSDMIQIMINGISDIRFNEL